MPSVGSNTRAALLLLPLKADPCSLVQAILATALAVGQLGKQGRLSSFEDPGGRSFIRFRNVQLTDEGLLYFHDSSNASATVPPSNLGQLLHSQYWADPERTANVRLQVPCCGLLPRMHGLDDSPESAASES